MERRETRAAIAAVLTLCMMAPATAEQLSHRAVAEQYLVETKVPNRLKGLIEQVRAKQVAALGKWYVPSETRGPAERYVNQATALLSEELSWERLKEEFVDAYTTVYSQAELEQLIAFYRSPLGQKYLEKRPQLVTAGLEITERHLKNLMPRLEALSQTLNEALKQARPKQPTSNR